MKGFLIHTFKVGIFQWLIGELETAFEEYDKDWSNVRFWSVKESLLHAYIALCKAKALETDQLYLESENMGTLSYQICSCLPSFSQIFDLTCIWYPESYTTVA